MNLSCKKSNVYINVIIIFCVICSQAYLEAFYKFCSNLGGTTADTMCPILEVSLVLLKITGPKVWLIV